jgi:hypothetical protein
MPRPLSFPILTLDESKLAPALGYLFYSKWLDPYESLISSYGNSRRPMRCLVSLWRD